MNTRIVSHLFWPVVLTMLFVSANGQADEPTRMHVNGIDLSYIEQGSGAPIILLHGALGDYSSWQPQFGPFAHRYRVIAYSRRYTFPNDNPAASRTYTLWTDVEDLAALIHGLGLHDVRLVGQSAGAFVALAFALKHPDAVRSLVLSEPPAHQLVRGSAAGETVYQDFMATIMIPAARHFRQKDVQHAMKIFVNGIAASNRFDGLSPEARMGTMRNGRSVEAICLSSDPFPVLSRSALSRMRVPALVVTGENTIRIHKLVNEELGRLLPHVKSVTIAGAGHGSPRENPPAFNEAVLGFLKIDAEATNQRPALADQMNRAHFPGGSIL